MADGPVIQASSQRALELGMNFDRLLELVARARPRVPLVLFSYLNPIIAAGSDALTRAADAGFSGLLAHRSAGRRRIRSAKRGLAQARSTFIRLVAPTTPRERMREIAAHGSGFVYLISRLGVTGMRDDSVGRAAGDRAAAARRSRRFPCASASASPDRSRPRRSRASPTASSSAARSFARRVRASTRPRALTASLRAAIDAA